MHPCSLIGVLFYISRFYGVQASLCWQGKLSHIAWMCRLIRIFTAHLICASSKGIFKGLNVNSKNWDKHINRCISTSTTTVSNDCISGQLRLWSHCTYMQADLDHWCMHITYFPHAWLIWYKPLSGKAIINLQGNNLYWSGPLSVIYDEIPFLCLVLPSLPIVVWVIGKQCRPRSDTMECGIWSGSPLFANSSTIFL